MSTKRSLPTHTKLTMLKSSDNISKRRNKTLAKSLADELFGGDSFTMDDNKEYDILFTFDNEEETEKYAVLDLLEIIREERYRDRAENKLLKKFERAIEDYESGDGKGAFISCLINAPRDEEGFASLTLPMYKTVCRTEPLFYYIMMTDYARFMTSDVYTSLCRLYTESICEDLPEFFEVDDRFEKIYRNKGGI